MTSKAKITLVASRKIVKIPYGVCQTEISKIFKEAKKPSLDF